MKKEFVIVLSVASVLTACGRTTAIAPVSGSSAASGITPAGVVPVPTATPTPVPSGTVPNLTGTYKYLRNACNFNWSYLMPTTHTLQFNGNDMTIYDVVGGCDTSLRETIQSKISYTENVLTQVHEYTYNWATPGSCTNPDIESVVNGQVFTSGFIVDGNLLEFQNGDNCDGNGLQSLTVYQKQ